METLGKGRASIELMECDDQLSLPVSQQGVCAEQVMLAPLVIHDLFLGLAGYLHGALPWKGCASKSA
jgi:hypothetical protein